MQNITPRILFVDDHEDTCLMVNLWLARYGYQVATAESFATALDIARNEIFDLYVFDTRLPDGTGADLCRRIREFDSITPIIFYSGETPEKLRSALASGAQDFVVKPELDGLRDAISRQMSRAAATTLSVVAA